MNELPNHNLLGASRCFRQAMDHLILFAKTDVTILIEGETGTGKELAARAAHEFSDRKGKPFIPVNCGALPGELAESELFGCERGAYTDAKQARRGLVMEANNGTLFLDEVEAMPLRVQVALLRFLQDHSFRQVGSTTTQYSNVRVIAATNISLEELEKNTVFRSDLIFRLKVLSVHLPPLRERGDDVLILAKVLLHRYSKQYSIPEPSISFETKSWFKRYHWPGNVRELENTLLRGLFLCKGGVLDIPPPDRCIAKIEDNHISLDLNFSDAKAAVIANFEFCYLTNVLHHAEGNVTQAARISGTERSAFRKLLRRNNLTADTYRLKSQH
jgi:DNA-binding NtrC family response regulator